MAYFIIYATKRYRCISRTLVEEKDMWDKLYREKIIKATFPVWATDDIDAEMHAEAILGSGWKIEGIYKNI